MTVPMVCDQVTLLQGAIGAWREALGAAHVIASGAEVDAANLATFGATGQVVGIIRPSTTAEVQSCMRVAHAFRVPVYAVSRGRNWGYGSRTPPCSTAVLMELHRMNRILEFSEDLAYVRLQPGVTFEQLSAFLEEHGSRLQMDATAGPHDGSLIGNALERGRSHGPTTGSARPVGDFQVVLADGRLVHTSSRRFPNGPHAASEPFPVGPDVTGLFFESNLGVVTEMTLWLARKPRHTRVLRFGLQGDDALERVVPPIRELMLEGVLGSGGVLMMNAARRRHAARRAPNHAVPSDYQLQQRGGDGAQPARQGLPVWPEHDLAWLCQVTVYSSDEILCERRVQLVKDALLPQALVSYEGSITNVGVRPHPEYTTNPLWTKPTTSPPDLDRDRIGYIFIAPVAPAQPQDVQRVYERLHGEISEHGFEPFVNLRFWDARSVVFVGSIVYDQDEAGADERARRCYERVMETIGRDGYIPYRLPTFAMPMLPRPIDDWGGFWADIKRSLDPHDVLSPGRYDFRYCWPVEA